MSVRIMSTPVTWAAELAHVREVSLLVPERRPRRGRRGKVFFARISGYTQTYPFLYSEDTMMIRPSQDSTILQALIDSRFVAVVGVERSIRNLGGPGGSCLRQGGHPKRGVNDRQGIGSLQSTRGRESRLHGEGSDSGTQPLQETCAGHAGPETTSAPP
jgi:hypothetical protein